MTWVKRALGVAGVVAIGLAVLIVVLSPSIPGVGAEPATFGLVLFAGLVAAVGFASTVTSTSPRDHESPFDQPPETATEHDHPTAGDDVDDTYRSLVDRDYSTWSEYFRHRQRLERYLRDVAVEVIVEAEDVSRDVATEAVADGSWTDDPRAASFLGTDAPAPPLALRVRDWLSGESVERAADHTIAELRELAHLPETAGVDRDHRRGSGDDDPGETRSDIRGGGVEGGEMALTDASRREESTVTTAQSTLEAAGHWEFGLLVAFALGGVGFVLANTTLVLASVVGLCFAIYGAVTLPPESNLDVRRSVSDESPVPGEPVDVSVTVTNIGDSPIAELRFVDGVPSTLSVIDGSPRGCVSLEPDESATIAYTVEAKRGTHTFDPVSLWTRNVSGELERSLTVEFGTELSCRDDLETVPTTRQTTPYQGRIETDTGGEGLEFFATREYRHNDPLSRIDWNYWAQTGDPRTVEFRQTRAGTVVVVLDDRTISARSRDEYGPDAVTLGQYAAVRIADALLSESNAVGGAILALGAYERPGRGRDQSRTLQSFFWREGVRESDEGADADSQSIVDVDAQFFQGARFDDASKSSGENRAVRDGGGIDVEWLRRRLPSDAQVLFITPLLDDAPKRVCSLLQADGADVTVVSPDVTTTARPGGTVAKIERQERLRSIRRQQFRVADWDTDTPLSIALERAQHRWSL